MSFVRDEARAALWRWRETLAGVFVVLLGLYWILRGYGLLYWVGFPVLLAGVALLWAGVPRGRFRGARGGPGVVQIVEGQVSYFGPLTGGMVDLTELKSLDLDATGHPAHWELRGAEAPALHIPVTAQGADTLFDAFQSLPGLSTARLMAALSHRDGRHAVWRRSH
ncbi:hypothetical protein [Primorskyibacter sp. S187A]|uniref:hypothetical protein n=1 Tax=Primorskyibacter sp. S187A TaxID=3415130 RepID=UPI003C7A7097